MAQGICITIGSIMVVTSRFLYSYWDFRLCGDSDNAFTGVMAFITDFIGTAMVVLSILSYTGII